MVLECSTAQERYPCSAWDNRKSRILPTLGMSHSDGSTWIHPWIPDRIFQLLPAWILCLGLMDPEPQNSPISAHFEAPGALRASSLSSLPAPINLSILKTFPRDSDPGMENLQTFTSQQEKLRMVLGWAQGVPKNGISRDEKHPWRMERAQNCEAASGHHGSFIPGFSFPSFHGMGSLLSFPMEILS